jgi:hypothetical protein
MINSENKVQINNLQKGDTLFTRTNNPHPLNMKNADRPFIIIILIAISLLYTIMAFIS